VHPDADGKVSATVKLNVVGQELTIDMRLPVRPTRPRELLPLYRGLSEHLTQAVLVHVHEGGRTVSCTRSCGACCRQLVPIAELEAWRIRELIDELPEARRAVIRERFVAARRRLAEGGLLQPLEDPTTIGPAAATGFGERYFALGIACPFLEDESCSIYEDRPVICREYLVTSPAANCAHPTRETIATVPVPSAVSRAIRWLTAPGQEQPPWVPLILAPEWAEAHPEPGPGHTGPELARELFERLSHDVLPPEQAAAGQTAAEPGTTRANQLP